jgi:hypothetical protein
VSVIASNYRSGIDAAGVNRGNMDQIAEPGASPGPQVLASKSIAPLLAFDSGFPCDTDCGERSLSPGLTTNRENHLELVKERV